MKIERDPVDPEAIDVWVEGHIGDEPCRFRLDTGAGTCRVPTSDATRSLVATGVSTGVAASGIGLREDEIELPLLQLGNLRLNGVRATRTAPGVDASPLLGMSALGRLRSSFLFSTAKLELGEPTPSGSEAWRPLDVHDAGQPLIPVCVGRVDVIGCWDTGAALTAVDVGFIRSHPDVFEPLRRAVGIDASGVEISSEIMRMTGCTIGDVDFPPTTCAGVDLGALNAHLERRSAAEGRDHRPVTFVVGMPIIHLADWHIDVPTRTWAVRPVFGCS